MIARRGDAAHIARHQADERPQIDAQEPELKERFITLQETVIGAMRDLFDELIAPGYMRPVEPSSTARIGRCCWMMWLSWLRFEQIAHPRNEEPGDAALYDAVSLNSTIVGHYFAPRFSAMMEAELRKALPGSLGVTAAPAAAPQPLGALDQIIELRAEQTDVFVGQYRY